MSTYRARILATAGGLAVHNTLHVSAGEAAAQDVVTDLADAWRARVVPLLHASYAFQGVELEDIATDDAAVFSAGTTGAVNGAETGQALPSFVCASVRLKTDRRGRAGAGRMGLGPLAESITPADTPNHMHATGVANYTAAVVAFVDDLASSTRNAPQTLAVVSYFKGVDAAGKPIKRPSPVISLVSSVSVNAVLGTRLSRHPNR